MSDESSPRVGIKEFLTAIRSELLSARTDDAGKAILKLSDVELEMSVVTTKEVNGEVKFWVVSIGGKYSKQDVHTVKLKFTPLGLGLGPYAARTRNPRRP